MILKEFNFKNIKQIYKQRMKSDFPASERMPYFILKCIRNITAFHSSDCCGGKNLQSRGRTDGHGSNIS